MPDGEHWSESTPLPEAYARLKGLVAECYGCRLNNGGYIPSELGDRLHAGLMGYLNGPDHQEENDHA